MCARTHAHTHAHTGFMNIMVVIERFLVLRSHCQFDKQSFVRFCVRNQFCLSVVGCPALSPSLHMRPFLSIFVQPAKSLNQYYAPPHPPPPPLSLLSPRTCVCLCTCVCALVFLCHVFLRGANLTISLPGEQSARNRRVRASSFCTSVSLSPFFVPLCVYFFLYLFVRASLFCTSLSVPPCSVPLCPCLLFLYLFICVCFFLYLFVRASLFCTSLSVPPCSVPLCPCLLVLYLFVRASLFCTSLSVPPCSVPLCPCLLFLYLFVRASLSIVVGPVSVHRCHPVKC